MASNNRQPEPEITIQDLYPELSPEQQAEAAYYLDCYIEVVRGIFERVENLTDPDQTPTIGM